jgi:cell division protein FtsI (penicillin-binding protein 3)
VDRIGLVLAAGITLAMLVLLGRVAQVQLAPSPELARHLTPRTSTRVDAALRGDIVDRRGRVLAMSRWGYRAFIDPVEFIEAQRLAEKRGKDAPTLDELITSLAEAIDEPSDRVGERLVWAMELSLERMGDEAEASREITTQALLDTARSAIARITGGTPRAMQAHEREQIELDELSSGDRPARPGPIRYLRIGQPLSEDAIARVRGLKLPGVHLERVEVREYPAGEAVATLVGKLGDEPQWSIGAESILSDRMLGTDGRYGYVRDARGRPLWVARDAWLPASRGGDVRLSIDLELQRIAHEELLRGVEEADAAGGRLVMVDPHTGEVLAMVDVLRDVPGLTPAPWEDAKSAERTPAPPLHRERPRYETLKADPARGVHAALGRNRCVEDVYEPGSTFKSFVWSSITAMGAADPGEMIDVEGGRWRTSYGRSLEDEAKRNELTWHDVLVHSSNIGMAKVAERLSFAQLREVVTRFGFGTRTGLGLAGETAGLVTSARAWSKHSQTSIAMGYEVGVTPVQMVRAFSAFARSGSMAGTLPELRLTAVEERDMLTNVATRVLPEDVVLLARDAMGDVAHNMETNWAKPTDGHAWRYDLFGKSGTAKIAAVAPKGKRRPRWFGGYFEKQYYSSFIAAGPIEQPRIVILVVIDDPGPERVRTRSYYGSAVAGPVVRRVMERGLSYLGITPTAGETPALAQAKQ